MSLWCIVSVPIVCFVAFAKGRGVLLWGLLSVLFVFWPLIPLILLPQRELKVIALPQFLLRFWGNKIIEREMKKINNVDDIVNG